VVFGRDFIALVDHSPTINSALAYPAKDQEGEGSRRAAAGATEMKTPILPLIGLIVLFIIGIVHCAKAQPPGKFLPPEEFDHPYEGKLHVIRVYSQDDVRRLCPRTTFNESYALACMTLFTNHCRITIAADDVIQAAGFEPDLVMRHEIGHCNGWPPDHKGAR
jgi:hypothetical protein